MIQLMIYKLLLAHTITTLTSQKYALCVQLAVAQIQQIQQQYAVPSPTSLLLRTIRRLSSALVT